LFQSPTRGRRAWKTGTDRRISVCLSSYSVSNSVALDARHSVDCIWNVIAHAQKPDFVFRRNGRVHLNRRGRQFSRLLSAEVCATAVVMLDKPCSEVVWRVLATHSIRQFPLHLPSRASPCAVTFQLESNTFCGEYFAAFWHVSVRSIRILMCVYATRQAMHVYRNTQTRSCNQCCSGEANKYYTFSVCICSLKYQACNALYHLWPAPLYNIFPHYLINGTILGGKKGYWS